MPNANAQRGVCNVCGKNVRCIRAKFHRGFCQICQQQTEHVVAIFGFPFSCRERHPNDVTNCAACLRPITVPELEHDAVMLVVGGPGVKRICQACDPLTAEAIGRIRRWPHTEVVRKKK